MERNNKHFAEVILRGSHNVNLRREIRTSPNLQEQDPSDQKQHKGTQKRPCQMEANQRIITGTENNSHDG